jgi:hypothetical protein
VPGWILDCCFSLVVAVVVAMLSSWRHLFFLCTHTNEVNFNFKLLLFFSSFALDDG